MRELRRSRRAPCPAPTVSFVASSTRTNAPVCAVRPRTGRRAAAPASRSRTRARSLSASAVGRHLLERLDVERRADLLEDRRASSASCASRPSRAPVATGRSLIQQTIASSSRAATGGSAGSQSMSPRETSSVVRRADDDRLALDGHVERAVVRSRPRRRSCARPRGARRPRRLRATRRPRPRRRSRGSRGARRSSAGSTHCTGKRRWAASRSPAISIVSRRSRNVPPSHHGIRSDGSTTLSPCSAAIGIASASRTPSWSQSPSELRARSRGTAPRRTRPGPSC